MEDLMAGIIQDPKRNGSVNLAPKTNHQADHKLFVIPD